MQIEMSLGNELRLPAIEVSQSPGRKLYAFAVDGKMVSRFATVSRVRRQSGNSLAGYQRPEVLSHIEEIRHYLESESPMVPNAVVVAFDARVRFEALPSVPSTGYSRSGMLVIPIEDEMADEHKPGFIVDGQQRLAAIRDASIEQFPVCVTAFITDAPSQQTEQFILVNSTKPLPKELIYELLPSTQAHLLSRLSRKRLPAHLLERLNLDDGSPLKEMIQTATNPSGLIKDNSVLKMLENSLSDGALYKFKEGKDAEGDVDSMLKLLHAYWGAVSKVFKDAWGLPPRKSRLMHAAGIVSMGFIMDAICDCHRAAKIPTAKQFAMGLEPLAEACRWTKGDWNFGPGCRRKWNELQNTSKDIEILANHLVMIWKGPRTVGASPSAGAIPECMVLSPE